jgi:hypothetical protein
MIIGVCSYSFAIGSLSSVLSNMDSKKAKLKNKLGILEKLRLEYKLNYQMYSKLKKALQYDNSRDESDKFEFISGLPLGLKFEMAVIMHQNIISKIPFFQDRTPAFISFVAPLLRPLRIAKDEFIFAENESINESNYLSIILLILNYFLVYFLVTGNIGLVVKDKSDFPYFNIEEGEFFIY